MKRLLWLCLIPLGVFSCAPEVTDDAPAITPEMLRQSPASLASLEKGRALYLAHCGRCHAYMLPENIRHEDWHIVVPGMAWNAGLSKSEETDLRSYILAVRP
ncbi:MAG: hypothetical protein RLZZ224_1482 [Verrucomicrobiota bacterium]|jgi:hypothetical protein